MNENIIIDVNMDNVVEVISRQTSLINEVKVLHYVLIIVILSFIFYKILTDIWG